MALAVGASDDLRCSDDDRERAVAALRVHHAVGRLDDDELEERIAAAYAARTTGAIAACFVDLPATRGALTTPGTPAPERAALSPIGRREFHQVHDSPRPLEEVWEDVERKTIPSLMRFGLSLRGRYGGERVELSEDVRPWWIWPVMPFFLPFTLVLLFLKQRRGLTIELTARADGGTRIVVYGAARRPVQRFLAELGPAHAS